MRVYKIILIFILAFILLVMSVGAIGIYSASNHNSDTKFMLLFAGIGIFVGLLAMWYHIVSFRYYRPSKRAVKAKKIPLILWIGAIASGVCYAFFGILSAFGNIAAISTRGMRAADLPIFIALAVIVLYGIFSIIETSILSKRIKKQKEECNAQNEIDEIGSSLQ
ncbi:hypothetical protein [Kordia sp.]|uniref:hypothetical protein n=1 Tax=Kordia sp. TaxID=1965332 RepID=UPI003B5AFD71